MISMKMMIADSRSVYISCRFLLIISLAGRFVGYINVKLASPNRPERHLCGPELDPTSKNPVLNLL